ncbi:MAG: helix-turn-helix transcriptional regulator [Rubrivivax sp.]|nr:helix-turn-helix transcriptional regulator [Rubrivivax sp.]
MRVHILHHASRGRIFGLEMIEELRQHGYGLSPGTLYPMLHAMERAGYLRCERAVADGKARKYYRATALGKRVLVQLKKRIRELTREVLDELPPSEPPSSQPPRR